MSFLPSSNSPSKHNLFWLCAASAAMAFGLNVTSVALPFILKHLGGSDGDVGLCIALNTGIYAAFCLVTAFLLDHWNPSKVTHFGGAGMGLAVLAMAGLVFFHHRGDGPSSPIPWMLWFYAGNGAATAFYWPYLMGWVSIGYEGKQLSRRLGLYNISWSLAACLGPFLGGVLVQLNPLLPLAVTVLTSAFSVFCVWKAGPAPLAEKSPPPAKSDILTIHPSLRQFRWIALLGLFLGHMVLSLVRSQLGIYMKFDLGFPEKSYGLVITFQSFAVFVANALVGWTHFWHYNRVLYALFIASLLISVGIITQTTVLSGFILACSLLGLCVGFLYSSHMYYGVSGGLRRASRMAIHEIALAAGYFTGSLGGGYLSDYFNRVWPYWFGTALVAFGAAMQICLWLKLRPKPPSQTVSV